MNFQIIKQNTNLLSNLYDINIYGSELKTGKVSADSANKAARVLNDFQNTLSEISECISITDINGNVVLDSKKGKTIGTNLSDREFFQKSIKGEAAWSNVIHSKDTQNPIIVYSVPLKSTDKSIIGTILIDAKFDYMTNLLSQVKVGEEGYAFMMDKNGNTLYHPETDKILKENLLDINKNNKIFYENLKRMAVGQEGKTEYTYDNIKKLMIYKPIDDWSIAINVPVHEYMLGAVDIKNRTIIISLIAILFGASLAIFAATGITNPIKQLMNLMKQAEKGDLTVLCKVNSKDEIGQLCSTFNNMLCGQQQFMHKVLKTAKVVEHSSQESGEVSQQMAASAQTQSSSAEELSASMNEMKKSVAEVTNGITGISENIDNITDSMIEMNSSSDSMAKKVEDTSLTIGEVTDLMNNIDTSIKSIAASSGNVSEEAKKTVEITENGKKVVNNTINQMNNISEVVSALTRVIKGLGDSAVQIEDIVEVIDNIAEQTNLLSLNASIEAARAGEYGKGFAVVAEAIGKLAEKSGEATKDIAKLIKHIQNEVDNAVNTTEEGAEQVRNGVGLVKNLGVSFEGIFEAVTSTTSLINEIAASTEAQAKTSEKVINKVTKVNDLSIESSTLVEEQTASLNEIVLEIQKVNDLSQTIVSAAEEENASCIEILNTAESVSTMAEQVSAGSEEAAATALELGRQAKGLVEIVSAFKLNSTE
jgi:methyl-accepting chemotaxis protein